MRKIGFHKYQALENDFLVIEQGVVPERLKPDFVSRICAPHTGIGADGVLFLKRKAGGFEMRIFNADGSEAEISGNGLRILTHHIYQQGLTRRKSFVIHTVTGDNEVKIISCKGSRMISRISLGVARFGLADIPVIGTTDYFVNLPFATASGELVGTAVSVGNPHIVFFVDNFNFDWQTFGREVESDRRFPQRINVEFAVVDSRRHLTHCSWERGVGITRASGTGASSSVAAGIISGYLDHKVTVFEPAGELEIEIPSLDDRILLTGPSTRIGEGIFTYNGNEENNR
jgi:diaminopimelate epimerase